MFVSLFFMPSLSFPRGNLLVVVLGLGAVALRHVAEELGGGGVILESGLDIDPANVTHTT